MNKQTTLRVKKPCMRRRGTQNDLTELRMGLCYTWLFREAILKEATEVLRTCMRRDVIMQSSEEEGTKA